MSNWLEGHRAQAHGLPEDTMGGFKCACCKAEFPPQTQYPNQVRLLEACYIHLDGYVCNLCMRAILKTVGAMMPGGLPPMTF